MSIDSQSLPTGFRRAMVRETTLRQPNAAPQSSQESFLPKKQAETAGGAKFTIPGAPVGKPRMTQRDKWAKRPAVMRYRAWADSARAASRAMEGSLPLQPIELTISAYLPMPKSWSAKKKAVMSGTAHRCKPDADNILKSCADALFSDDSSIWRMRVSKRWEDGNGPRLEVEVS